MEEAPGKAKAHFSFSFETSQGSSIMHMGQIRVTRRMVRGVSAIATYGFQKSIDNASTFGGGGGAVAQNDQNLRLEPTACVCAAGSFEMPRYATTAARSASLRESP